MVKKISNLCLFVFLATILTGCGSDMQKLTEASAVVAFIMLIVSIVVLKLIPKIHKWDFPRKIFDFFIAKISLILIFGMVLFGIIFLFAKENFSFLISLTLFISSAFLYKLQNNYANKDKLELEEDKKNWLLTLVTLTVLLFLFFGGLYSVLK